MQRRDGTETRLVIMTSDWGCLTWPVRRIPCDDGDMCALATETGGATWWFVTSFAEIRMSGIRGCVRQGLGVALRLVGFEGATDGDFEPMPAALVREKGCPICVLVYTSLWSDIFPLGPQGSGLLGWSLIRRTFILGMATFGECPAWATRQW